TVLRRFGYRNVLTYNALIASGLIGACALFTAATPVVVMIAVLFAGGFFRSLQFTSAMTIGFAEIEPARMSRATSLAAVAQQLSVSTGVALGALAVETVVAFRHGSAIAERDFAPAFLLVGAIAAASAFMFTRMPTDTGAELIDRPRAPVTAAAAKDQAAEGPRALGRPPPHRSRTPAGAISGAGRLGARFLTRPAASMLLLGRFSPSDRTGV